MIGAARDQIPTGMGPRKPDRARRRIGAVAAELDHFGAGNRLQERLRALDLDSRRPREVRSLFHRLPRRGENRFIAMAETDGAVAHAVFDELVSIDVPDPAPLAALDEAGRQHGILVVAFRIGMAAAGNDRMGAFAQLVGPAEHVKR